VPGGDGGRVAGEKSYGAPGGVWNASTGTLGRGAKFDSRYDRNMSFVDLETVPVSPVMKIVRASPTVRRPKSAAYLTKLASRSCGYLVTVQMGDMPVGADACGCEKTCRHLGPCLGQYEKYSGDAGL